MKESIENMGSWCWLKWERVVLLRRRIVGAWVVEYGSKIGFI